MNELIPLPPYQLKPHNVFRIKSILSALFPKAADKFDAEFLNKKIDKIDRDRAFTYQKRFNLRYAGQWKIQEESDSETAYHHYTIEALDPEDSERLEAVVKKVYKDASALNWIWDKRQDNRYKNFAFASKAEVAVAIELSRRKILFFANPTCLIADRDGHQTQKRPDFLVFYKGQSRILEVDGKNFHENAPEDYKRDRIFQRHGIPVTRFTADECLTNYERAIDEFLELFDFQSSVISHQSSVVSN